MTYGNNLLLNNHHAFLVLSERDGVLESLKKYLKNKYNFSCSSGNPDYWQKEVETFGIEDSRDLKERHLRVAIGTEEIKVFILKALFMTREAQNALLKVLEEPFPGTFFFFILPSIDSLLPTLRSRLMISDAFDEETENVEEKALSFDINYFLSLSPQARIKLLGDIIENKNKGKALQFLGELESVYRKKVDFNNLEDKELDAFETIIKSRKYLANTSSSIKIILENISLAL